jgi:xylan 1,4-beta-xylosidase
MIRYLSITFACCAFSAIGLSQHVVHPPKTWCNPLNIDYAYVSNADSGVAQHRSTADPAIVTIGDTFFLFATNQEGYWWSDNFAHWNFVKQSFKHDFSGNDVCAPAALALHDTILFLPCFTDRDTMPLYEIAAPPHGSWIEAVKGFPITVWDPGLFRDDDGKMYVYWGSSNVFPIRGAQIDPSRGFKPVGVEVPLILLHPDRNGWERFGEENTDTTIDPYVEGAWMTKHDGRYYLQYAAPGTEYNVYSDGVYVGDGPLGPFKLQEHNPFSSKRGGFITGAGHGSTFPDRWGNWWHVATCVAWIKHKFERRIGIYPAGFDKEGVLYANTSFGDYPQKLAGGKRDQTKGGWTGWVILSYKKPAKASTSIAGRGVEHAFDENIRTYWSAASSDSGEWVQVDLKRPCLVHSIQVNYADEGATLRGKVMGICHCYRIYSSVDGRRWSVLIDKSTNTSDIPHDYVELDTPVKVRFLKLVNIHVPTGKFAVSGFRVFGNADEAVPPKVAGLKVVRNPRDSREAEITWNNTPRAFAYNLSYGVSPEKRYTDIFLHDSTHYTFRGMTVGEEYSFSIQAVGEGGAGKASGVVSTVPKKR